MLGSTIEPFIEQLLFHPLRVSLVLSVRHICQCWITNLRDELYNESSRDERGRCVSEEFSRHLSNFSRSKVCRNTCFVISVDACKCFSAGGDSWYISEHFSSLTIAFRRSNISEKIMSENPSVTYFLFISYQRISRHKRLYARKRINIRIKWKHSDIFVLIGTLVSAQILLFLLRSMAP